MVLCWYHLSKRVYEILGLLRRGKTAEAVRILWGLRSSARVPERIDGLLDSSPRKRRIIVDYTADTSIICLFPFVNVDRTALLTTPPK